MPPPDAESEHVVITPPSAFVKVDECWRTLKDRMAKLDTEVEVHMTEPVGPYLTDAFVCPHGISYWIYPTGAQIAAWVRDGVA